MGIKGIYGEIGAGERIALSRLAVENYEKTGRPLRIAIDIAIWQFQIQAGRGGSDPAIRTLYYRLLRLLALTVQPLFVFDGPNKPPLKRNKRTGPSGGSVSNMLTKQLLNYFGFPYHYAPGEAEAECALLQQNGIVDAVLSEDVDTLMFGSEICLRNWSSEDSKGNKAPTHISAYFKKSVSEKYGLDREGMILIALMSGGDYNTEGIPGCGIKLACEAARAGFGKSLCQIARSDAAGYKLWRENLSREINTNSGKLFKTKHNKLKIPENFPDKEILAYYTHPVVSNAAKIMQLREEIQWHGKVDVPGLRHFVAEAFEWTYKPGAIKFIRGLAPALLVHKLRLRGDATDIDYGDIILTAMNETEIVRNICGRRVHFSSDGIAELRLIYHPLDIVGINLDMEQEEPRNDFGRNELAPCNLEDFVEDYLSNEDKDNRPGSLTRTISKSYDPTQPHKLWVPRTIARVGVPLKVEDYEDALRDPKKFLIAKAASKKAMAKRSIPSGTLNEKIKKSEDVKVSEAISKNKQQKPDLITKSVSNKYSHANLKIHTTSNSEVENTTNEPMKSTKNIAITKSNSSTSRKPSAKTKMKALDTRIAHSNYIKSLAFTRVTKPQNQDHKKLNNLVDIRTPTSISTTSSIFNTSVSEKKRHSDVSISSFQINGKT
ncbi:Flap endonuclease 1 [Erysiphe neolycopersici]|uniref:Flap endonuclease 1 n=1 Tax=Erysiphe neolycopersici TaxID=212602 RepID=A0A420I691_9PEZI|nr:Flap endonuclease 1 [Erysiphe neolycopersici]